MIAIYICIPVVALLFLWLFLIAPGCSCGMEEFKSLKYAHRGLHGNVTGEGFAAENSLTAFRRAIEAGYGIEFDVQVTKDGVAVVFHDATLTRICGVSGKVKDMAYAELAEFSLSGTEDKIPTLREVLELVSGKVPLLIELKETGLDHTISEKTAELLRDYNGKFIIESFSPFAFGAIKREFPKAQCGFIADKHTDYEKTRTLIFRLIQRSLLNVVSRPAFISLNKEKPRLFPIPIIKKLFRTPTLAWTIKSEEEEVTAYKNGFSGIIFEGYLPKD